MPRLSFGHISLALVLCAGCAAMASCASNEEATPPETPPVTIPPAAEGGSDAPSALDGAADVDAGPPSRCSLDAWCHTDLPEGLDAGVVTQLSLRDVFATSDEAWAVSRTGEILHHRADVWTVEHASGKTLRAIGGTSPTDLWAVGDEGVVLRRTVSGATASWSPVPSGTTGNLQSVWGAAPGDLWIVGTNGAMRSKGTPGMPGFGFVLTKPPAALLDGLTGLYRVWGTDAKNVWVLGPDPCLDPDAICEYGSAHLLRYATAADGGARWSRVDLGLNPLFDVAVAAGASTPDNLLVVAGNEALNGCVATDPFGADAGDAGRPWGPSGVCFQHRSVWMNTAAQGWSVGTDGLAQEWTGKGWRPARLTITAVPVASHLYAVRGARTLWESSSGSSAMASPFTVTSSREQRPRTTMRIPLISFLTVTSIGIVVACSSDRDGFGDQPTNFAVSEAGADTSCGVRCSRDLKTVVRDCDGPTVETCGAGSACGNGTCVEACAATALSQGSVGCSFWALPPDPYRVDMQGSCYAAIVANTWAEPVRIEAELGTDKLDLSKAAP